MSTWLPRALGAATAAYGTAVAVKPELLARPTGLTEDGRTPPGTVVLCRAVGVRDLISGVSIAAARSTPGLRGALAARVAADVGDAAVLGAALPDRDARTKAAAVALSWGTLCGLSALAPRRRN